LFFPCIRLIIDHDQWPIVFDVRHRLRHSGKPFTAYVPHDAVQYNIQIRRQQDDSESLLSDVPGMSHLTLIARDRFAYCKTVQLAETTMKTYGQFSHVPSSFVFET
jgi:hypothetical protein